MSETDFLLGDFYTNPEEAITEDECMTSDDMNDAQCQGDDESATSCKYGILELSIDCDRKYPPNKEV